MQSGQRLVAAERPLNRLPGRNLRWLADHSVGASSTAALENVLPERGFVPSHHHEVEELLVCLEGRGEMCVDGEVHEFSEEDTVIVPAESVHGFCNMGDERMRVLAFFPSAKPGVVWEDPRHDYSWHATES